MGRIDNKLWITYYTALMKLYGIMDLDWKLKCFIAVVYDKWQIPILTKLYVFIDLRVIRKKHSSLIFICRLQEFQHFKYNCILAKMIITLFLHWKKVLLNLVHSIPLFFSTIYKKLKFKDPIWTNMTIYTPWNTSHHQPIELMLTTNNVH